MTTIDHAAEAERILRDAQITDGPMAGMFDETQGTTVQIGGAYVHAVLALVEATHEVAHRPPARPNQIPEISPAAARGITQLFGPREIWLAYYDDWSGLSVFPTEVEAYRFANGKTMNVRQIEFGKDIQDQVRG